MNASTNLPFTYVDTEASLLKLMDALARQKRAAIDIEADGLHHYFEKVCLIQLSFEGQNFIVDPLADLNMTPFLALLAQKELIIHAADYDLRMLKKTYGFRPNGPVFDTMLAAQVLGLEKVGLAALVEMFFGVILPKTGQKADWARRPLTGALLAYASDDTKYLEMLADQLEKKIVDLGRLEWLQECCARSVFNSGLADKNDAKESWRVKGSSKLSPGVLVFLRELWNWRDGEAQMRDRPPFMIMRNDDLIAVAEWRARHRQAPIQEGPVFLKRIQGSMFERLQQFIEKADRLPQSDWPKLPEKSSRRESTPSAEKVEPLMTACRTMAEKLKIEPSFLASRATLTAIAQHKPQSVEKAVEVSGMMSWQAKLMMPEILKIMGA